jgi:hypothetical protein
MVYARAAIAHAAVLMLTSLHHWYGAVRFDTPWRAHVIHLAVWIGVALGVLLSIGWLARGRPLERWAVLAVVGLSMLAAVAWLGLYEGGYNHLVKDALFAAGASDQIIRRLFPPTIYEPPGDWVFELSGIAQLPLGLLAGWSAMRLWRTTGGTRP